MNSHGIQRRETVGKFDQSAMAVSVNNYPWTVLNVAVDVSAVHAKQKSIDVSAQTDVAFVCSGTPRLFGCGLGILKSDTADTELGSYILYGVWKLPIKDSDTPAVGDWLYWDDSNKYLTTTSGGNSKVGVSMQPYAEWVVGSDTVAGSNPTWTASKWGRVEIAPRR